MEPLSVPFVNTWFTPNFDGLITVRGLVRTEPEGLVIEFRRTQTAFGGADVQRSEIRSITVPWTEIKEISFRSRLLFRRVLVLRTRTLRALDGLPGTQGNEAALSIPYREWLEARELSANVELALAEQRLAILDAASAPPSLPPG